MIQHCILHRYTVHRYIDTTVQCTVYNTPLYHCTMYNGKAMHCTLYIGSEVHCTLYNGRAVHCTLYNGTNIVIQNLGGTSVGVPLFKKAWLKHCTSVDVSVLGLPYRLGTHLNYYHRTTSLLWSPLWAWLIVDG